MEKKISTIISIILCISLIISVGAIVYQYTVIQEKNNQINDLNYNLVELKKENWAGFTDLLDVVAIFVWASKDLVHLDRYVDQRQGIFPGKPINVGCYLRDFTLLAGVPMEMLKFQWELVRKALADGTIQGYSILGGLHIDLHPEQATWVRDFIRAN